MNNDINLLLQHSETFFKVIRDIYHYLKDSKYSGLFPNLNKTNKSGTSKQTRIDHKRKDIVGSRIKLHIMKNIYKSKYLDKRDGNVKCPDCLREDFIINLSTPRKRSKDFHHSNGFSEGNYNRYDSNALFSMFAQNRGNPYFLEDIIREIESESDVLKCANHHRMIHYAEYFTYFRKLIFWEKSPKEFPYQDIFVLPADIIHILVLICLGNFYKTKTKTKRENIAIKLRFINAIKKKYIIDCLYDGTCLICGEFNTKNHLPVFDYNHLYEMNELTPREREVRKNVKIPMLYNTCSCSEIVREMEKKYHKGGYICSNCHFVIHRETANIKEIYDDQTTIKVVLDEKKKVIRKFRQNLVQNNGLVKDPLRSEKEQYEVVMNYLFVLYKISRKKTGGVSRKELAEQLGVKECKRGFEGRKFLEKYVKMVPGNRWSPTLYFLTPEGENVVQLMQYFKEYYKNLKNQ